MTQNNHDDAMSTAERKRKLLAEGSLLRLGILDARATVRDSLAPEALVKGAMGQVSGALRSFAGVALSGKGGGATVQLLAPFLFRTIGKLSKNRFYKTLLYAGTAAAMSYYLVRKRKAKAADDADQDRAANPENAGSEVADT